MSNKDDDQLDDEEEAEELLKDDEAALEAQIIKARASKNPSDIVQVAIKSTRLADLYYEALETFSSRYFELKEQAAEYYSKLARDSRMANAELMAVLMYLQANMFVKAKKILNKIKGEISKKSKKGVSDEVVISICDEILEDKAKQAEEKVNKGFYDVDKDVQTEISRTLKYVLEIKRK